MSEKALALTTQTHKTYNQPPLYVYYLLVSGSLRKWEGGGRPTTVTAMTLHGGASALVLKWYRPKTRTAADSAYPSLGFAAKQCRLVKTFYSSITLVFTA